MEINLNVADRLTIMSILPTTGKIQDLVEVFDIVKKIKFSDSEQKELNMTTRDNRVYWDTNKELEKPFEMSIEQIKIIKDKIKELDERGAVSMTSLETCLKFSKL